MAPILTYLKIHKSLTIPVRLTINLQKSTGKPDNEFFQSAINVQNNTRLVKLSKMQKVYLSNNQIREILLVFKDDLMKLLVAEPIDVLKLRNEKLMRNQGKDTLSFVLNDVSGTGWKIRVVFTIPWIESLRSGVGEKAGLIVRAPKISNNTEEEENPVIQEEEIEQKIPKEGEVIEVLEEDVKFEQKYDYERRRTFEGAPLKIEVLQASMKR